MKNKNTQDVVDSVQSLHVKRFGNFQIKLAAFSLLMLTILAGVTIVLSENQSEKLVPGSWSQLQRDDYLNGREPSCGTYGCIPNDPMSREMYR